MNLLLSQPIFQTKLNQCISSFGETYVLERPIIARGRGRLRRNQLRHPPRFAPTEWSIYHFQAYNLPRTNNTLEAWHRQFKTVVGRYHLGMYSVIKEFIKENHTDQEMEQLTAGNNSTKKRENKFREKRRLQLSSGDVDLSLPTNTFGGLHTVCISV